MMGGPLQSVPDQTLYYVQLHPHAHARVPRLLHELLFVCTHVCVCVCVCSGGLEYVHVDGTEMKGKRVENDSLSLSLSLSLLFHPGLIQGGIYLGE